MSDELVQYNDNEEYLQLGRISKRA